MVSSTCTNYTEQNRTQTRKERLVYPERIKNKHVQSGRKPSDSLKLSLLGCEFDVHVSGNRKYKNRFLYKTASLRVYPLGLLELRVLAM